MNEWNGVMRCHAPASVVVVVARPPVFADEVVVVGGVAVAFSHGDGFFCACGTCHRVCELARTARDFDAGGDAWALA